MVTQATLARVLTERDAGEVEFEQVPARADPDDLPGLLPPVVRVAGSDTTLRAYAEHQLLNQ